MELRTNVRLCQVVSPLPSATTRSSLVWHGECVRNCMHTCNYSHAEDGRLFTTRSGLWVPVDAYDIKGKPIHISAGSNFLVIATSSGHVYQVPAAYSPTVPSKTTGALPPLRKPARVTGLPFNATKPSPSPKVKPGVPPPPLAVDATRVAALWRAWRGARRGALPCCPMGRRGPGVGTLRESCAAPSSIATSW